MDVVEDLVVPMMNASLRIDRDALILGYAGEYSSFLLFAKRAAERYGPGCASSYRPHCEKSVTGAPRAPSCAALTCEAATVVA